MRSSEALLPGSSALMAGDIDNLMPPLLIHGTMANYVAASGKRPIIWDFPFNRECMPGLSRRPISWRQVRSRHVLHRTQSPMKVVSACCFISGSKSSETRCGILDAPARRSIDRTFRQPTSCQRGRDAVLSSRLAFSNSGQAG